MQIDIKNKDIKVVILAGGLGTRLSEYTKLIPKPMIKIKKKPILMHIVEHYQKYGFKNFILATGYKSDFIVNFFKKKKSFKEINLEKKNKNFTKFFEKKTSSDFLVINTGLRTMTGGRLKRLEKILLKDKIFCLTYGDGISNVNLNKLINIHKKHGKIATITAVRPPSRFGALKIRRNTVEKFQEKTNFFDSWINGGFFVFSNKIFNFINNDLTFLEKEPLQNISRQKQMIAFKHKGFWHCMDTLRDKKNLEYYLKLKNDK